MYDCNDDKVCAGSWPDKVFLTFSNNLESVVACVNYDSINLICQISSVIILFLCDVVQLMLCDADSKYYTTTTNTESSREYWMYFKVDQYQGKVVLSRAPPR